MRSRRNERGVALFIVLFALLLLSGIGMGLLFMSDVGTAINSNYRDSQRAYFGASAGLQEMRERLMSNSGNAIPRASLPTALPTAAGGVIYITNPAGGAEVVAPWNSGNPFFDDELCHENFPGLGLPNPGANVPCTIVPGGGGWYLELPSTAPFSGSTAALPYKWARLTLKSNLSAAPFYVANPGVTSSADPICWNGKYQVPKPAGRAACDSTPAGNDPWLKPVYRVTSLAVTASGSRRMTQVEMADNPPIVTNAAVDSQDHVTLNGQLFVNGYDNCSCLCTEVTRDNWQCDSRPGKTCDRTKWAIYSANTVDNPTRSESIIAGQVPPIAEHAPWDYDIPEMIKQFKTASDAVDVTREPYNWACPGTPGHYDCGTRTGVQLGIPPTFPPNPVDNPAGPSNMYKQVTYVPGNLHMTGGGQGNGILVVDGDLEINGGLEFYGLILVRGVVRFTGGGSARTNIYGAVLAGQQSIDDTVLGGSASIYYDICSLLNNRNPQPPTMITAHELSY